MTRSVDNLPRADPQLLNQISRPFLTRENAAIFGGHTAPVVIAIEHLFDDTAIEADHRPSDTIWRWNFKDISGVIVLHLHKPSSDGVKYVIPNFY
jgi:hypothetical protein